MDGMTPAELARFEEIVRENERLKIALEKKNETISKLTELLKKSES